MSGLIAVAVAVIWAGVVLGVVIRVCSELSASQGANFLVALLLLAVLLPAPFADELISKRRFEWLCASNEKVVVDALQTRGRTVWFGSGERTELDIGILHVVQVKRSYVDAATQEPVYHYFQFEAAGGWLARTLIESGGPLTFQGSCRPKGLGNIESVLGITRINRPTRS
jgi:hypothetical protein